MLKAVLKRSGHQWCIASPMGLLFRSRPILIAIMAVIAGGVPLGIAMVGGLIFNQIRALNTVSLTTFVDLLAEKCARLGTGHASVKALLEK
jgi:hypothetical protein